MRIMVLFTRDLRVHDHPALWEACRTADDVVPSFVIDPDLMTRSPNRARFLSDSVIDLDRSMAHRGGRLIIREGNAATEAAALAAASGSDEVFLTSDASSYARAREERLQEYLAPQGIRLRVFPGHSVVEPGDVHPQDKCGYRVFTPYWRSWSAYPRRPVLVAPKAVRVPENVEGGRLPQPSRYTPTASTLPPGGEWAARRRVQRFISEEAPRYGVARNDLAGDATSRLSPYLRFGCVSPNELVSMVGSVDGSGEWIRQIAWRDFFQQLLSDEPSMANHSLRPGLRKPVGLDEDLLDAWTSGRTGIPLVDAGMRQLVREGWMHNRARMVTASFLTRTAGVPWQEGARVFARHLVDADPANNAGNWQWVAGTGPTPGRNRPLNPIRQARRFDPTGTYVRRYVPELRGILDDRIFRPWADQEMLRSSGYLAPVLDVPGL